MIQIFDKFGRLKSAGIPGLGTVTAVSTGNLSPLFTTAVSSSTTTPNVTFSAISQPQKLFYASPNNASGIPSFRSIVASDLPSLSSIYFPYPTGTISQYIRGDGSLATFPDFPAIPTKTSDLTNDGADGINPFITLLDVPTPSLQDTIDVDKNADRVRFYKDVFPITEWSTFNYMVSVVPSATDSRFYTYGDFTFGGIGNDIARFNPDGTYDTTFNVGTGLNNAPFSGATVLPLSDGKVYLSGSFTSYNGTTANRIIKLNENGSIDTSFDYGIGFNVTTTRIAVDSNDKIYVGSSGASGNYQGVSTGRLVRLNTDGTRDNTFSTGVGFNNTVIDVKLDSSDKVYVSGYFTTYQGTTARGIIRLNPDASIDTGFSYGTGVTNTGNNVVNNIELIQSEDKILLYGMLTGYNGTSANRIIKLNEDGTIEPTFLANIGTGFNDRVFEAKITSYGTILCTGSFTSYNGVTTNRSIELNLDGTIYKAFPQSSLYNAYLLNDDVFLGLTLNSGTYTLSPIIDYYPVNTKD